MNIKTFKIGDIVVINNPEYRHSDFKNIIYEIEDVVGKSFYGIPTKLTNKLILNWVYEKEIRYATEKEKFLYYILGPHVLGELDNLY